MELGSGSETDVMEALDQALPRDDRWRHRHGSPGHGADHVLPLLAGPSLSVPVHDGQLALDLAVHRPARSQQDRGDQQDCGSRFPARLGRGSAERRVTCCSTSAGSVVGASQA